MFQQTGNNYISDTIMLMVVFIPFMLVGFFIIASAQVYLAIRETALNSRINDESAGGYGILKFVAMLFTIFGWIIVGFGLMVSMWIASGNMSIQEFLNNFQL